MYTFCFADWLIFVVGSFLGSSCSLCKHLADFPRILFTKQVMASVGPRSYASPIPNIENRILTLEL